MQLGMLWKEGQTNNQSTHKDENPTFAFALVWVGPKPGVNDEFI